MKHFRLLLISSALILMACSGDKPKDNAATDPVKQVSDTPETLQEPYATQSTDEQTANNLKVFLMNYVGEDYSFLTETDKKFQFYQVDLNEDGNKEIFVRLMGPYFCGSGGCTFLLLDKYGEQLSKFTVTRAPFFKEPSLVNGWSLLLVKDNGVFKELRFEDGSYPGNPSVLPKAPYDAPSGHAEVIFGEGIYQCKTHEF